MNTSSFNFFTPTKLIFGPGKLNDLKEIAPNYGQKCLIVSRPKKGSLKNTYLRIEKLLNSVDIEVFYFDEIVPNPTLEGINKGVAIAAENKVDFILGVGGGSVMDSAKLIALLYESKGVIDWKAAFSNYDHPFSFIKSKPSSLPFLAVSTTSGTGSQCTQAAVVSDTKNKEKITLFHLDLFPKAAIIDPELMLTVPDRVTAATGFDAFTHAFESYLGGRTSPLTEQLSLQSIKLVIENLPKAINEPNSIEYRTSLAWADTIAGICLSNGGADIPHPLGEIIGGICQRIPHGETLAMVYPKFLNYKKNIAIDKFETIANYLGLEKKPEAFVNKVIELLNITSLSESLEKAEINDLEKNEILSHPLLKNLDPKNEQTIFDIMNHSINP
ncbi:MAG: alcohol dehydrogenase [Flavobacteriaceae bacterium]|nr:alcohol dehydrogenase [Flavobacteriaceae bacterium]|tara:strand:- start:15067 stop:16224 length:1158 start_codon:yes stop_codon:yes gene_type:complete